MRVSARIEFVDGRAMLELPRGAPLSEHLTILNSPVLFGCRTGICGSCVVAVEVLQGELDAIAEDERDVLQLVAEGRPDARLACQLRATADLCIGSLEQ